MLSPFQEFYSRCPEGTPHTPLVSADLNEKGPVSLSPLRDLTVIFHTHTAANGVRKHCIGLEAAKRLMEPLRVCIHTPQSSNDGLHTFEITCKNSYTLKIPLVLRLLNIPSQFITIFKYKCPVTRKELLLQPHTKYRIKISDKKDSPWIYECILPYMPGARSPLTDKQKCEEVVIRMVMPWIIILNNVEQSICLKPAFWIGRALLHIANKTKLYKTCNKIFQVINILQRFLISVVLNWCLHQITYTQTSNHFPRLLIIITQLALICFATYFLLPNDVDRQGHISQLAAYFFVGFFSYQLLKFTIFSIKDLYRLSIFCKASIGAPIARAITWIKPS